MIDFSTLQRALETLEEALAARADRPADTFIRDACIRRFEYSYELSHKMLRRYLEATEPSPPQVVELSFPNLIRLGYERGILASEWMVWKGFRDARNITSHTYDEAKAEKVLGSIAPFLQEAKKMLREMTLRQEKAD